MPLQTENDNVCICVTTFMEVKRLRDFLVGRKREKRLQLRTRIIIFRFTYTSFLFHIFST